VCSFSWNSFPEIASIHASKLVNKIKEESTDDTESETKHQLLDKIASLSNTQLARAKDALTMIWNGTMGPSHSTVPKPEPELPAPPAMPAKFPALGLALLKSISTGTFIDVRFCAYNAIRNDLQLDPKPLFTSSIVIKGFSPAIEKRELEGSSSFAPL
jgi:hypothetical protein